MLSHSYGSQSHLTSRSGRVETGDRETETRHGRLSNTASEGKYRCPDPLAPRAGGDVRTPDHGRAGRDVLRFLPRERGNPLPGALPPCPRRAGTGPLVEAEQRPGAEVLYPDQEGRAAPA